MDIRVTTTQQHHQWILTVSDVVLQKTPAINAYIFNFWHSGTLALRAEGQSARMSEIKNVIDLDGQV